MLWSSSLQARPMWSLLHIYLPCSKAQCMYTALEWMRNCTITSFLIFFFIVIVIVYFYIFLIFFSNLESPMIFPCPPLVFLIPLPQPTPISLSPPHIFERLDRSFSPAPTRIMATGLVITAMLSYQSHPAPCTSPLDTCTHTWANPELRSKPRGRHTLLKRHFCKNNNRAKYIKNSWVKRKSKKKSCRYKLIESSP